MPPIVTLPLPWRKLAGLGIGISHQQTEYPAIAVMERVHPHEIAMQPSCLHFRHQVRLQATLVESQGPLRFGVDLLGRAALVNETVLTAGSFGPILQ